MVLFELHRRLPVGTVMEIYCLKVQAFFRIQENVMLLCAFINVQSKKKTKKCHYDQNVGI